MRRCSSLVLGALVAVLASAPATPVRADRSLARRVVRRMYDPRKNVPLPGAWNIAGQSYVSPSEYRDLRNGCMELLRRYPPDKYFFVGLGRDPAPVIAFLQNVGEKDLAVNLPGTSNIGWNGQVGEDDVARHVEAAIPAHILRGERTIVILDVTGTGKTPAVFGPYLDRYLQGRGNTKTPVRLAFSWNNVFQQGYGAQLTDWINTAPWPDFGNYFGGKYEGAWTPEQGGPGIAEHQWHAMARGARPPTATNPNYGAFRQAVFLRMEQDPELDRFLATLAPRDRPIRPAQPPRPWPPQLAFKLDRERGATGSYALLSLDNKSRGRKKEARWDDEGEDGQRAAKEPASYDYLASGEYGQLRDGALAIMGYAAPSKAFYVGVGRSSGALVAFFENLGSDVATYLPADGLQKLAKGRRGARGEEALDALFDAFIPEAALRGTRKIVLFQRSESGASLPYLHSALSRYLMERGSPVKVDMISLAEARPEVGAFLDIRRLPELRALNERKYHLVAPYGYFRHGRRELEQVVDVEGRPQPRSQAYRAFKRALRERMIGDAVLDREIRTFAQ